jgi:hypothetical protein
MPERTTQTLKEGELYVFERGELRHIDRPANDMPKVLVSKTAHESLLDLRRRCRKALGGFRPDLALVASAIVEHGACASEAETIVARYSAATSKSVVLPALGTGGAQDTTAQASSLALGSDDAASPLLARVSARP